MGLERVRIALQTTLGLSRLAAKVPAAIGTLEVA
jgi:hypothetical protein